MPDKLSKPIQAVNIKFERDVAKYLKPKQHLKKLEDELAQFKANQETGTYPSGVRPFKPPGEQVELEQPWSGSVDAEATSTIKLPMGTTIVDAMHTVHYGCAWILKEMDYEQLKKGNHQNHRGC
jgi:hypothetical protein